MLLNFIYTLVSGFQAHFRMSLYKLMAVLSKIFNLLVQHGLKPSVRNHVLTEKMIIFVHCSLVLW